MTKKETLRRAVLRRLRRQSDSSQQKKSLAIGRRLFQTRFYRKAQRLLCYAAMDGEVQTRPILEKALLDGKKVFVPVVTDKNRRHMVAARIKSLEKDLSHRGPYGIPHPLRLSAQGISLKRMDLILVPGVAFDARGVRLGRGLGYFDRFLSRIPASIPRVGLAYECQMAGKVPAHPHDERMQAVVTEKKSYENPDRR